VRQSVLRREGPYQKNTQFGCSSNIHPIPYEQEDSHRVLIAVLSHDNPNPPWQASIPVVCETIRKWRCNMTRSATNDFISQNTCRVCTIQNALFVGIRVGEIRDLIASSRTTVPTLIQTTSNENIRQLAQDKEDSKRNKQKEFINRRVLASPTMLGTCRRRSGNSGRW
jgi:hypothetical protein